MKHSGMPCALCGGRLKATNMMGVCQSSPECRAEYSKRYKAANPSKKQACNRRWYAKYRSEIAPRARIRHLRRTFGITAAEYDAMLASQDGKCAICGGTKPGGRYAVWHVDHDHSTGAIRGLLCVRCNLRLATLEDEDFCGSALKYIDLHRHRLVVGA